MRSDFLKFFKGLSMYTLLILCVCTFLFSTLLRRFFLPIFPVVLVFYYLSTLALHRYMLKIASKDISKFSMKFMLLSFVKMFLYIVFGVLYIIVDENNAVVFLIVYLALYVIYAIFEVKSVMNLIDDTSV